MTTQSSDNPLYHRLGGRLTVELTVAKLYDKILKDPLLKPFFAETRMEDLQHSQTAFVIMAFGGPHHYKSVDLRSAHMHSKLHGLTHKHFDATADHLADSMRELNIDEGLIDEAMAIVETTRADVLNL